MHLDVSKALVAEGVELPFQAEVVLPDTALLGERVTFPHPAQLAGYYASVGDTVHVRGKMTFAARAQCVRCLTEAEHTLETSFDALFALQPSSDDPDLYAYGGAWIDLQRMASDAALLALPLQWFCREDCKGLCPVCGEDQNINPCSCRMEASAEHPFSALQQLLTKDESEV